MHHRHYLTSVTSNNACEAMLISLFWGPSGLNELPEVHYFQIPFHLWVAIFPISGVWQVGWWNLITSVRLIL